jgi:Holliday junction resolvase RusA-like endonuclease
VIPEAPPSVNHTYKLVRVNGKMRKAKEESVLRFQAMTAMFTRLAKPKDWKPAGHPIRITYEFYLRFDIDCDNAMKALNDAIAQSIGVNDRRFLPCVVSKHVDRTELNPRVVVEIGDPSDWGS